MLAVVWLGGAGYLWLRLNRGWWPWDEGTMAEPAARILRGELPHRDFVDAYTGLLSYFHAAAFLIFGEELTSLRLVLFTFFVAWLPAVYYVASRFVGPVEAGLVTLAVIAWSVPNYPASVPSWYCTFFATFGLAALLRHIETKRTIWLIAAGLAGASSILIKITGVYFVAGALVYLLVKACTDSRSDDGRARAAAGAAAAALAVAAGTFFLLHTRLGAREFVDFLLPVLALALFTVWAARDTHLEMGAFVRLVGPFLAGLLAPLAIFTVPYIVTGSTADLARDLWPTERLRIAAMAPPSLWALVALAPLVAIVAIARDHARLTAPEKRFGIAALAVLAVADLVASRNATGYFLTWQSLRALETPLLLVGFFVLSRRWKQDRRTASAQRLIALFAITTMCSLIQFPFSAPIYFTYVAPLVILSAVALAVYDGRVPRPVLWTILLLYLAFGVVRLNPGTFEALGYRYEPARYTNLDLPRGGLEVTEPDRRVYDAVIGLVRHHAGSSRYTYATPDAPEIYFLSGLLNPTRTLDEFLAEPPRPAQIERTLIRRKIDVVVVNLRPAFAALTAPGLRRMLAERYPHARRTGRFVVRWR